MLCRSRLDGKIGVEAARFFHQPAKIICDAHRAQVSCSPLKSGFFCNQRPADRFGMLAGSIEIVFAKHDFAAVGMLEDMAGFGQHPLRAFQPVALAFQLAVRAVGAEEGAAALGENGGVIFLAAYGCQSKRS